MGEEEAEKAGFSIQVLPREIHEKTTADDTRTAVKSMVKTKVDLIVF